MKILGKIFLFFFFVSLYGNDVEFKMIADKKEVFVGEPTMVKLKLKIKKSLQVLDYKLKLPKFNGFWVKRLDSGYSKNYTLDSRKYLIKNIKYIVFAEQRGLLKIEPASIKLVLAGGDNFDGKPKIYKSNSLEIISKPLPKDVDLIGRFTIKTKIDKKVTKSGEPVNFEVNISGYGNIENFSGVELKIPTATIFKDRVKRQEKFEDGKLKAQIIQKFSIISDRDYTIPSLKIEYFDPEEKELKLLETHPVKIHILNAVKKEGVSKNDKSFNLSSFFIGFFTASALMSLLILLYKLYKKRKKEFGFSSSEKELLNQILPFVSENKELELFAKELYEKIYENKNIKVDKKRLIMVLNEMKKSRHNIS